MHQKSEEKRKLLESEPANVISLVDLADGTWLRKKTEKRIGKLQKKKENRLKRRKNIIERDLSEIENLRKREADLPRSVESQRVELFSSKEFLRMRDVKPEHVEKIRDLCNSGIADHHLEPYDYHHLKLAKGM